MLLLRSFNRFIFLSLALYGLSTVTVNAKLIEADSEYGENTVTRDDESGLEWLDLTQTTGDSYLTVKSQIKSGQYEGWRYASTIEIETFFIHASVSDPDPFTNDGAQGDNVDWIDKLLDLWGTTSLGGNLDPGAAAITGATQPMLEVWLAALALDFKETGTDYAFATYVPVGQGTAQEIIGSALVRSYVPLPAAAWLFGTALIGLIGFGKRKARIAA